MNPFARQRCLDQGDVNHDSVNSSLSCRHTEHWAAVTSTLWPTPEDPVSTRTHSRSAAVSPSPATRINDHFDSTGVHNIVNPSAGLGESTARSSHVKSGHVC